MNRLENLENKSINFIDYNNKLATINTREATYVATQNCAVVGAVRIRDGSGAVLYVNGIETSCIANPNATTSNYTSLYAMIYVEKGSTVTTRADHGEYNLAVYALK